VGVVAAVGSKRGGEGGEIRGEEERVWGREGGCRLRRTGDCERREGGEGEVVGEEMEVDRREVSLSFRAGGRGGERVEE
jgi:hypothetical protein